MNETPLDSRYAAILEALIRGEGCCHINDKEWSREWWNAPLSALDSLRADLDGRFDQGFLEGKASRDEEVLALEARLRDSVADLERVTRERDAAIARTVGYQERLNLHDALEQRSERAERSLEDARRERGEAIERSRAAHQAHADVESALEDATEALREIAGSADTLDTAEARIARAALDRLASADTETT